MLSLSFFLNILAILLVLSQSLRQWHDVTELHTTQTLQIQAEVELQWCGQIEANKANLLQAVQWAQATWPQHRPSTQKAFEEQMRLEVMPRNFKAQATSSGCCTHPELKKIQTCIYRQKNSSIPQYWPNWHFRFVHNI